MPRLALLHPTRNDVSKHTRIPTIDPELLRRRGTLVRALAVEETTEETRATTATTAGTRIGTVTEIFATETAIETEIEIAADALEIDMTTVTVLEIPVHQNGGPGRALLELRPHP